MLLTFIPRGGPAPLAHRGRDLWGGRGTTVLLQPLLDTLAALVALALAAALGLLLARW